MTPLCWQGSHCYTWWKCFATPPLYCRIFLGWICTSSPIWGILFLWLWFLLNTLRLARSLILIVTPFPVPGHSLWPRHRTLWPRYYFWKSLGTVNLYSVPVVNNGINPFWCRGLSTTYACARQTWKSATWWPPRGRSCICPPLLSVILHDTLFLSACAWYTVWR